jgi:8-hydroxy-5-deazaflavin:NADPH oxidoreductase
MRIGVLGTGDVGRTLARGFAEAGHDVVVGSRDANSDRVKSIADGVERLRTGTFEDAATHGDVIIIATLWTGTENALHLAGEANCAGKTVIDATNPLDFSGEMPTLSIGGNDSAGEQVQRWLPDAKVVKAFNGVGNVHMVKPEFPGGPPDVYICGNDAESKRIVTGLAQQLGLETVDIGGLDGSRYLEPLAMVWIRNAIINQAWNTAFKLLRK